MSDQRDQYVHDQIERIHAKLDRLDEAIRGNGKIGILRRLDRLESLEAVRGKVLWILAAAVLTIAAQAVLQLVAAVVAGGS